MSFDPITAIWAANKAAEMAGGSGGTSGAKFSGYIRVSDYPNIMSEEGETLTDEQYTALYEMFAGGNFRGLVLDTDNSDVMIGYPVMTHFQTGPRSAEAICNFGVGTAEAIYIALENNNLWIAPLPEEGA